MHEAVVHEGGELRGATGSAPGPAGVPRLELAAPAAQSGAVPGGAALAGPAEVVPTSTLLATGAASQVAPNILSITHWERLLGGELYAPHSRVDWATLLRRTFDVDVKRCRNCGGRMTVRAYLLSGLPLCGSILRS